MITIFVNENPIEIEERTTIEQLLQKTNNAGEGIAVAINNEVISKNQWNSHNLSKDDKVLLIKAAQGG